MFNTTNYNLQKPHRNSYCNVPMNKCVENFANIHLPDEKPLLPNVNLTVSY